MLLHPLNKLSVLCKLVQPSKISSGICPVYKLQPCINPDTLVNTVPFLNHSAHIPVCTSLSLVASKFTPVNNEQLRNINEAFFNNDLEFTSKFLGICPSILLHPENM